MERNTHPITQALVQHIKTVLSSLFFNVYVERWVTFSGGRCITVKVTTSQGRVHTFEQEWPYCVWDEIPTEVLFDKIINEVTFGVVRNTIHDFSKTVEAPTFYSWKNKDF